MTLGMTGLLVDLDSVNLLILNTFCVTVTLLVEMDSLIPELWRMRKFEPEEGSNAIKNTCWLNYLPFSLLPVSHMYVIC